MITYRTTRMERFLKELPDSNVSKAYRKGFGPKISDEEIFMFSDCLHNGLYFQAIPLALVLSATVLMGMKKGKIRISKKYGIWPKTIPAFAVGFTVGFFLNSVSCAQRFMTELP